MVKYCYASISEKGTVNGKKGDQTGREVKLANEYNFGQKYVFRMRNTKKRLKLASAMRRATKNDNIGYGQGDRTGVYLGISCSGWKRAYNKIKTVKKCNADCSSLVCACINATYGRYYIPCATTYGMINFLKNSEKEFKEYTYKKGMTVKKGDIIIKNGHVVVVYKGGKTRV